MKVVKLDNHPEITSVTFCTLKQAESVIRILDGDMKGMAERIRGWEQKAAALLSDAGSARREVDFLRQKLYVQERAMEADREKERNRKRKAKEVLVRNLKIAKMDYAAAWANAEKAQERGDKKVSPFLDPQTQIARKRCKEAADILRGFNYGEKL